MATVNNNTPTLRFPEFKGEWELKKLSTLLEFKNGINATKEQYGSGYKFINVLDILNNDFITHDNIIGSVNVDKIMVDKFPVNYGDILFQRSSETREEVGTACVYLDKSKTATFGGFVIRGRKIAEYEPIFLNKLLKTDIARDEITSRSGGSTRFNVGQETLSSIHLNLPTLPEQQKIATFLTTVDEKLQALKQKKSLLEQYKKGVMQKIFSQELRFKDDNGNTFADWEEKKLGEVADFYKGKGLPKSDIVENGKFKCLHYGELFTKYKESIVNILSSTDAFDKPFLSIANDVLMPTSDVTPNGLATASCINEDDVILGGDVLVIRQKIKVFEGLFFSYYVNQYREKVMKLVSGSTVFHLYGSDMKKLEILIPCLEEQTKIATFLSAIDEKINQCQAQITNTEVWKKGLLQRMFV